MKDEQGTVIMCMKYEKNGSWKDLEKNSLYPTLKTNARIQAYQDRKRANPIKKETDRKTDFASISELIRALEYK